MADGVDISVLGDKELERKLKRLAGAAQRKVVRQALRANAKRTHQRILGKIQGDPIKSRTGRLLAAWKATKPKAGKRSRSRLQVVVPLPDRSVLGLTDDQGYYPTALEYGRRDGSMPARPYIRPAVDEKRTEELRQIGRDIGRGIEREARKS